MNYKRGLIAAMAMMAVAYSELETKRTKPITDSLPKEKIIIRGKGVKEFWYGENVIYAINQKNADRKAKKLGYLK